MTFSEIAQHVTKAEHALASLHLGLLTRDDACGAILSAMQAIDPSECPNAGHRLVNLYDAACEA